MNHDEFRELLAAYALGLLESAEVLSLEAHLQTCHACSEELAGHFETMADLADSVPQLEPPLNLRARVLGLRASRRASWQTGLLAAALILLLALSWQLLRMTRSQADLQAQLQEARRQVVGLRESAGEREKIVSTLGSVSRVVALEGETPSNVKLLIAREGHSGLLVGDLPLQDQDVYQVWLIAAKKPISVGIIHPKQGETAVLPIDTPMIGYQAVAVTLEKGPSGAEQPTSKPLWVGKI